MKSADLSKMVSVIIPVYKVENYIRECVDSVLAQTYTDLEIILVDDGSPDNCGQICDEYAARDSRVRVIHKENGGLSDARNAGLDIARGKYIYFVDSDDYIKKEAVEYLVKRCEQENADIVYCNAETVYEDFEDQDYTEELIRKNNYRTAKGAAVLAAHFKHDDFWACAWLNLLRRDFIEKNGLRFLKGIMHEDELFTPVAYVRAERVAYLADSLYIRRLRAGSIMSEKDTERSMSGMTACLCGYINELERYPCGSLERKVMLYSIDRCAGIILLKYLHLNGRSRRDSYKYIRKTAEELAPLHYTGSRKIKLKLAFPNAFGLLRKLLLPVRERFF